MCVRACVCAAMRVSASHKLEAAFQRCHDNSRCLTSKRVGTARTLSPSLRHSLCLFVLTAYVNYLPYRWLAAH